MKRIALCVSFLGLLFSVCYGQPINPILRINTEIHSDIIRRVSSDKDGKRLLTCSNDKTAKLWDAETGTLLSTFRVPIDQARDGELDACALSPDGTVATLGGWTAYNWEKACCIYVLNTSTGEITTRLKGIPNVIQNLKFSPDGQHLAAALDGKAGIRIYNTATWSVEYALTDYGNDTYGIAFDKSGRMATASLDGRVRLYDADFQLIRAREFSAAKQPMSVSFSPSGSLLAVGFHDSPHVMVLDGRTLDDLYSPEIPSNASGFDFSTVGFSTDGQYLYSGGSYNVRDDSGYSWDVIRRWTNQGNGPFHDFLATGNSCTDLSSLPDKSIAIVSTEPDLRVIRDESSTAARPGFYRQSDLLDLSSTDRTHFRVSYDGYDVGFTPTNDLPESFSIRNRLLVQRQSSAPPFTDHKGSLTFTSWDRSYSPQLNGTKIGCLARNESCVSVDIADDEQRLVIGGEWNLYCLDASGTQIWRTPTNVIAPAVNIAANGKIVVGAFGDGTICWFRMSDGKKLLTLFVHSDKKRWILWTESGYYDCSPGGEDLIGWHINDGPDKAPHFYPASKFRAIYYRPDVVSQIMETFDEQEAIRLADQERNKKTTSTAIADILPPTIGITSPTEGTSITSTSVTVHFRVDGPPDAPVTSIKPYIDGRPIEGVRGMKAVATANELTLEVPARDCKVSLIAENRFGFSDPAVVTLIWKGPGENRSESALKPKLYVLAVGISEYADKDLKLGLAAKDARDFSNAFLNQKGLMYGDVVCKLLTDKEATKDNILDALDWLQHACTSRDVAMLFLAGHGINDNSGVFYFLPVNANPDAVKRTCLMFSDIKTTVSSLPGKVILFVDACHSGNVFGAIRRGVTDVTEAVNDLTSAENGAIVFTSSTGRQYSLENAEWGNGAFTKALVEGIRGKADLLHKGKITVKTLDAYVEERVKELTNGQQSPTTIIPNSVPDFPIVILR